MKRIMITATIGSKTYNTYFPYSYLNFHSVTWYYLCTSNQSIQLKLLTFSAPNLHMTLSYSMSTFFLSRETKTLQKLLGVTVGKVYK
jgi:hypothetical protein